MTPPTGAAPASRSQPDGTSADAGSPAAVLPGGTDVAALGYEQARDALAEVVSRLEAGGTTLEQSLALWERGEALAGRCEEWLAGARARLDAARAATQERSGPAG